MSYFGQLWAKLNIFCVYIETPSLKKNGGIFQIGGRGGGSAEFGKFQTFFFNDGFLYLDLLDRKLTNRLKDIQEKVQKYPGKVSKNFIKIYQSEPEISLYLHNLRKEESQKSD